MEKYHETENNYEKFNIIMKAREFMKGVFNGKNIDIDYYNRIYNTCIDICKTILEADVFYVGLISILFDIDNEKIFENNKNNENLNLFLKDYKLDEEYKDKIIDSINAISKFNENQSIQPINLEECIIMDAIILEHYGATGLSLIFSKGGKNKMILFDPNDFEIIKENERIKKEKIRQKLEEKIKRKHKKNMTSNEKLEEKKPKSIIGYLEEEIINMKNKLHTDKAKLIAIQKQEFMFDFLKQFYKEIGEKEHIKNIEDKKNNEIEKEIERFSKKKNKEIYKLINEEKEKENQREIKKNNLDDEIEQEKLEEIFEIERGKANKRILEKKKEIEKEIEDYKKLLKENNNSEENDNKNNENEINESEINEDENNNQNVSKSVSTVKNNKITILRY